MLRSPRRRSSWGLLSAGFIIAAFFHFPTAPIAFLISTVGIIYVSYVAKSFDGLWRRFIIYLGFPAVAWCAYLLAFQEVSREYVVNRSAYYRLAPSTVLKFISIGPEFFAFMIVGVLAALSLLILTKKRENLFVGTILIMWLVAPLVFLTISYALGIGTDYSRFIYYFIPPSIAAISIVFGNFVRMLAEANQQARSSRANGLTVIIVTFMLLVIFNLRFSLHFYHQTVDDLSLVYRSSFRTAVSWINDHQISGTIFAPSRPEATWIEGLTGNDTLFPEEFRYIYRPGMMQRALDAHQIDSGTPLVVDNGYMRIYLHEPGEGSRWHPYVTVYDRGEYAELITLQDHLVSVSYSHRDSLQSLQLSEDFDVVTEVVATPVGTKVVYTYEAILHPVVLTKQVFLPKNGSYMQIAIDLHFSDQFHGREMNLKFADIARLYGEEVIRDTETTGLTVQDSSTVQLFRGSRDGLEFSSTMRFVVESGSPLDLHHDPLDEAFLEATYDLSNTNGVSTSIRLETSPPERFPTSHEASTLQQVLNLNQVQLAMIRKTNYLARNQLDQMGFKLVHANPNYLIFNTTDPAKPDQ